MPRNPRKSSTRSDAATTLKAAGSHGAEAFAREFDIKLDAILGESKPLIESLQPAVNLKPTPAGVEIEWNPTGQSVPLVGNRARDAQVMAETTLEQLAGLLQMVAHYGELTGDPRAEMPEFLARRVKQVTEFAQGLERALAAVRPREGAAAPGVVQDELQLFGKPGRRAMQPPTRSTTHRSTRATDRRGATARGSGSGAVRHGPSTQHARKTPSVASTCRGLDQAAQHGMWRIWR